MTHVLIIHTDQHRKDCIGCYGNHDVRTPHIDSIAADGVVYDNSYCSYPVCTPSRYSLLTGLHVNQHLGRSNHSTLPSGLATLPSRLKGVGYHTTAIGKMHFTPTYLDVGFTTMMLSEQDGPGRLDDDYHKHLMRNQLVDSFDIVDQRGDCRENATEGYWSAYGAGRSDLDEMYHSTTWIGDQTVEAIKTWNHEQPQMMMIGFIKPHHPFDPPAPYDAMYDPKQLSILDGWMDETPDDDRVDQPYFPNEPQMDETTYRNVLAMYYGSITEIDDQIGRIIAVLKERNLYNDTMIVFTSDHGDYMGYHHMLLKGRRMYEPLMNVPLIIKYPDKQLNTSKADNRMIESVDISATILDCLQQDGLPFSTGKSLMDKPARDYAFAQSHTATYMVRDARYKMIWSDQSHHNCLYDLINDPYEMQNLFDNVEYDIIQQRLQHAVMQWMTFDVIVPTHTDERAATIGTPARTPVEEDQREDMEQYLLTNYRTDFI